MFVWVACLNFKIIICIAIFKTLKSICLPIIILTGHFCPDVLLNNIFSLNCPDNKSYNSQTDIVHNKQNASFIRIQWSQSCELKFSISWFLFQLINVEMIAVSLRHLGVQFLYGSLGIWELECWDPQRIKLVTGKWKYVLMVGWDIDPLTPVFIYQK